MWISTAHRIAAAFSIFMLPLVADAKIAVSSKELTFDWPLTISEGFVACRSPSQAIFQANGDIYPLNGAASSRAKANRYLPLEDIWREHPEWTGVRISIAPLIKLALSDC
jgi:hypothetical protein